MSYVCKKCGANDLSKSDLVGDYGCVYCFDCNATPSEAYEDNSCSNASETKE